MMARKNKKDNEIFSSNDMNMNNINIEDFPISRPNSAILTRSNNNTLKDSNNQNIIPPTVTINDITDNDLNFFKTLSDNLKYVFNSPLPSKQQFPTPFSTNNPPQPSLSKNNTNNAINMGTNNYQQSSIQNLSQQSMPSQNQNFNQFYLQQQQYYQHFQQNPIDSTLSPAFNNDSSFHVRNPDSSFIDKTLNFQLLNKDGTTFGNTDNQSNHNILQDSNLQPSSVINMPNSNSTKKKNNRTTNNKNSKSIHLVVGKNKNTRSRNDDGVRDSCNNNNINININNMSNLTNFNNINNDTNPQNSNNIPQDFLLPSPEHLRDFLYDSPAGLNLFSNTPAKSPLRFMTGTNNSHNFNKIDNKLNIPNNNNNNTNSETSNLLHLFNSVNSTNQHISNNENENENSNDTINDNQSGNINTDRLTNLTRTPLRKLDINLMFSSYIPTSASPSKKLSMSLTPYGRRILNDMGTPYITKNIMSSSNSALVDFQKARKDTIVNMSTPTFDAKSPLQVQHFEQQQKTPSQRMKLIKNGQGIPNLQKYHNNHNTINNSVEKVNCKNGIFNTSNTLSTKEYEYDSSPTTIQLHSSVTKSLPQLSHMHEVSNKVPVLTRNISMLDKSMMDLGNLSPTPKSNSSNINGNLMNTIDMLPIPELPKMGSFKSIRSNSTLTSLEISNPKHTASTLTSSSDKTFHNSTSTLILQPNILKTNGVSGTSKVRSLGSGNSNNKIKKNKVKKTGKNKEPKFQIFVSSIHKFNDPNAPMPLQQVKSGTDRSHTRKKRQLKK